MNHFNVCGAQQRMAETETAVRYVSGDNLVRPKCQEAALPLPFFDDTKGTAGYSG
jgi:hypothetical protein